MPQLIGTRPRPATEFSLITAAVSARGTTHIFELKDGWVWFTYQPEGDPEWNGGEPGDFPARLRRFAPAPGVLSIEAVTTPDGTLYLFGRHHDGSVVYTYQKPDAVVWKGGVPGEVHAILDLFAPA